MEGEAPRESALKLIAALRRVRVDAMMMMRSRFFASNCGNAEMPSSSGISISSTATSGLMRSSWLTASRPVRSEAATTISGSAPIQREIMPRMTTESSTTITRNGSCRVDVGVGALVNAILITSPTAQRHNYILTPKAVQPPDRIPRSDEANFLELRGHDVLVERLHDVLVGAGMQRACDMGDIVFGGAEHHLCRVPAGHAAQLPAEFVPGHDRPV